MFFFLLERRFRQGVEIIEQHISTAEKITYYNLANYLSVSIHVSKQAAVEKEERATEDKANLIVYLIDIVLP